MSKLYAEIISDKGGRVVSKCGNDYITIRVKNKNICIFDITFRDDGQKRGLIDIMSYRDATSQTIEY